MPIYEYQCGGCVHEFEEWQKITDKPLRKCPSCSARRVERLVSMTSFQLKGGGWYVSEYGKGSKGKGAKDAAGSNGDASAKGDKKAKKTAGSSTKDASSAAS
jgi:putative FmdB family regulatory protein